MTKLIFLGCLSSTKYKKTCENAVRLIKMYDEEYAVMDDVPCCGALAYHVASDEELINHAKFVNDWFKSHDITDIVTICAGCYNYLTRYYNQLLGPEFKVKVRHLLQLMATPENASKLNLKHNGKKISVCYHDACHLKNAMVPIMDEPRMILNSIENVSVFEMENRGKNSICCGAGGGVYSIFKENSDYNAKTIFDQMRKGKVLLTACPFCYTAFLRIKEENNIRKPVLKFEDFIIKIIDGVDPLK